MGVSVSKQDQKAAERRNREIEQQLRRDKSAFLDEVKLLMLGAGESGKSTVVKQMRIIHLKGFDKDERARYRDVIYANTLDAMVRIIAAMRELQIDFALTERYVDAQIVLENAKLVADSLDFNDTLLAALQRVWADSGVQECMKVAGRSFQLDDSAAYFLGQLKRIGHADYEPSEQDILHARVQTTGIVEINFSVKGLNFRMFDVGGQRSERRRWIHCFQDVTAIIFVSSLSEYDQVLREDGVTNRMQESLKLYDSIRNNRWFQRTTFILFLNKRDLFAEKLLRMPLTVCFSDYEGTATYDEASQYVAAMFAALNRSESKANYCHMTCATDTKNIGHVFDASVDVIIRGNLRTAGIF